MGIDIELSEDAPIITQRIFTNEGISFVSFTYRAKWEGDNSQITLKENEISEFAWLSPNEAISRAVSGCDSLATLNLTVDPTLTSTTDITICETELPLNWNGLTLTTTARHTSTLNMP